MSVMATRLFVQYIVQAGKENKAPHYWPFAGGIHRCPVDSLHYGPVNQKTFECGDKILVHI